jgi:hypothetical protein
MGRPAFLVQEKKILVLVCVLLDTQGRLYRSPGWIAEGIEAVRPGAASSGGIPEKRIRDSIQHTSEQLTLMMSHPLTPA